MYNIMQQQAGTRYIGAMSNGKMTRTTHYKSREDFLTALEAINAEAKRWGEALYTDVSPIK